MNNAGIQPISERRTTSDGFELTYGAHELTATDDDGNVRDISIVSGDSRGAFAVAARRALRQR